MNLFLQIVNFVGVLLVAGLCVFQWNDNGQLHRNLDELDRTRQEQVAKIADQEKTINANNADLDDLRAKLAKAEAATKDIQGKLDTETARNKQLAAEHDRLVAEQGEFKTAIERWQAAIAQRDETIKQADQTIQKLSAERNDDINKYNDLMNKYNGVVKDLNAAQAKLAGH